jgi:4-oxalocrotonate tautomerase
MDAGGRGPEPCRGRRESAPLAFITGRDRSHRKLNLGARTAFWWTARQHRDTVPLHRFEELGMPNVIVQQLPKSPEATRDLVRRITDAFVDACQTPAEAVHVWIEEYPADRYASGGTLLADK